MKAILIWGTQLSHEYHTALAAFPDAPVILIEADSVCRKFQYHQQKIVLVLSAMRHFAAELRRAKRTVHYVALGDTGRTKYFDILSDVCGRVGVTDIAMMDTADISPRSATEAWCQRNAIGFEVTPNGLFLTGRVQFSEWAGGKKRLLMEDFYRWQRNRLNILVSKDGRPEGGQWNYDHDNRKPLPKGHIVPGPPRMQPDDTTITVIRLVRERFGDHIGTAEDIWVPVCRDEALRWLDSFICERLANFGTYEDAMKRGEPVLYHSVMTPLLNTGIIHPLEIVAAVTSAYNDGMVSIATTEGYIRQVIGWREFMYGMYHYKMPNWDRNNFFKFKKPLPKWWYTGIIDDPALVDTINRAIRYGYLHHIERLMVAGNFMLLSEYSPHQAYKWFMELFIDSYEWVMMPNVYGMSQFADGGSFATKPYISSGSYLQKMGKWYGSTDAAKDSRFTKLYWRWLDRHRTQFESNPRMAMMYRQLDRRKKTKQ